MKGLGEKLKIVNARIDELDILISGRKIVFYGVGNYLCNVVQNTFPDQLVRNVAYAIDSHKRGSFSFKGMDVSIRNIESIINEKEVAIIISSPLYALEMYNCLIDLKISESNLVIVWPFVMRISLGEDDESIKKIIFSERRQYSIPKKIHCFWFSKERKPDKYQYCIDSWKKYCPDYEICEWNSDNYDVSRHPFMKKAFEKGKWAFVSDIARIDVVNELGGIYFDMDFELLKSINCLIGNKGFFPFDCDMNIGLESFGSVPNNDFLKKLLYCYDEIEFRDDMNSLYELCQPYFLRRAFKELGVKYNGNMQLVDGMAFLPRKYLAPQDSVLYDVFNLSEETIGIHHCYGSWIEGRGEGILDKKAKNNLYLWGKLDKD